MSELLENPECILSIDVPDINVSWNAIYSSKGTWMRKKLKKQWHRNFSIALEAFDTPQERGFKVIKYRLEGRFNTRMDVGNHVCMKFFNDVLQEEGWVENDSPKYCVEERYISDKTLPKNVGRFKIIAQIEII